MFHRVHDLYFKLCINCLLIILNAIINNIVNTFLTLKLILLLHSY